MSMSANPSAVTWEVLSTTPGTGPDAMGHNVPGHVVNARLLDTSGSAFQVFIPNCDLGNLAKVQATIHDRAAAIYQLSHLTNSG